MSKIDNFLKNHDLEVELLNDAKFVEEAQKIIEDNGLEFSEDQLREIVYEIEKNLEKVRSISDEDLQEISGGTEAVEAINPGPRSAAHKNTAAEIAIKATSTVVGALIGGGIGMLMGGLKINGQAKTKYDKGGTIIETSKTRGYTLSSGSILIGGASGTVAGYKLGVLIAKKCLK